MIRILRILFVVSTIVGCSGRGASSIDEVFQKHELPEDAIVLRVQVVDVEFTDLSAGCGKVKGGMDCIPFYFWYRYKAKVKEALIGDWAKPTVEFTYLQHAQFIDDVTRDCFVVLRPAKGNLLTKVGVPFVADKLLSRFYESHRPIIKNLQHAR